MNYSTLNEMKSEALIQSLLWRLLVNHNYPQETIQMNKSD